VENKTTNWSFGTTHFNILMLCVVYEGIGYPLMWTMLEKKKGNSNSTEQMDLLECFEKLFLHVEIDYLTGDRELIGKSWLSYLMMDKPIPFRLRMRQTDKINRIRSGIALIFSPPHAQPLYRCR
jgi:hypothetical protein